MAGQPVAFAQHEVAVALAVADAGRVGEDVPDRRWAVRRHEPPATVRVGLAHLEVLPLRDPPLDRVVEAEVRLLVERHHRHAGDRLGHRVQPPDRVVGDRQAPLAVAQAEVADVAHRAAPHDRHLRAGDLAGVQVARPEVVLDACEPVLVEPRPCCVHVHPEPPCRRGDPDPSSRRPRRTGWHACHRRPDAARPDRVPPHVLGATRGRTAWRSELTGTQDIQPRFLGASESSPPQVSRTSRHPGDRRQGCSKAVTTPGKLRTLAPAASRAAREKAPDDTTDTLPSASRTVTEPESVVPTTATT
ncbi:unannotated protein [freshwater metagenome]|uniref:Unannotated protein n=1 Tax=freshwater metagenome TaxID=449393 RepID=A0A6J6F461_9ZZZZ